MIARVITDLALDRVFDYLIPDELASGVRAGSRVTVPFGHGTRDGFVLELAATSRFEHLKSILSLSGEAHLPEKLVDLGKWMADYYCCSREQAIRALLPGAVRSGRVKAKLRKYCTLGDENAVQEFLKINAEKKSFAGRIEILQTLQDSGETAMDELVHFFNFSASSLATLIKHGLVVVQEREVRRNHAHSRRTVLAGAPLTPTPEQKLALDTVDDMLAGTVERKPILLRGVTNSGKTEVYLQTIAKVLALKKGAIVLVPEISLTPQTVSRFRARFGDELSILHSGLSDGERFDEWFRILRGEARIVVGARSALFAPLPDLGLIVVDEEHESSYKQSEAPRYSARDVAVVRGKMENALVMLGSATPSGESIYNAQNGKYHLIELKSQAKNQEPPLVRIIDQRAFGAPEPGKSTFFSPPLIDAVKQRLERHEQVILFLNRRGYARVMLCDQCGFEARCPDCSVAYTYSKLRQTLECHFCGGTIAAPEICPQCGDPKIRFSGVGTEKVEAAAHAVFGPARIARMDSDTMRSAEDYEDTLGKFKRGDIDILIGTQMIAKGLHFPDVTLVGVINADASLAMPDFRAEERTFQLLTQVAGRAGRGSVRGEVLIQTCKPENETILCAAEQDFEGFVEYDMEAREVMKYPPFSHLILVHFRGEDDTEVRVFASGFTEKLQRAAGEGVRIQGPFPAPIDRIKGKYRFMTMIFGEKLGVVRRYLRHMVLHGGHPDGVDVYVDVDAQALL